MSDETNRKTLPLNVVVCWKTTKTANGYSYTVFTVGYQIPTVILKTADGFKSRAIAANAGKARKRYYAACQKQGLLID